MTGQLALPPFLVNIADMARSAAEARTVCLTASVNWFVDLARTLPDPPLRTTLKLIPTGSGLMITGVADVTAEFTCSRCLDLIPADLRVEISQLYATVGILDEADYQLDGDEIDLEPMLRDEVLLAMPVLPVCGDNCPGPSVEEEDTDWEEATRSPFAILKELLGEE